MNLHQDAKGWVCLDIDGTLTNHTHILPNEVIDYLHLLHQERWQVVFVTGRMHSYGLKALSEITFPYFYIPQNGASWYHMPEGELGHKNYIQTSDTAKLLSVVEDHGLDLMLFSGIESRDKVYYRSKKQPVEICQYIESTLSKLAGQFIDCGSQFNLDNKEFAYAKVYGQKDKLFLLLEDLKEFDQFKIHIVGDSVSKRYHIIQIMDKRVNKGSAILDLIGKTTLNVPIIAAGNDLNDEPMLDIADIKIAMEGSPKQLIEQASLIAAPVEQVGIVEALKLAVKQLEG